jgi:hypothetical protein
MYIKYKNIKSDQDICKYIYLNLHNDQKIKIKIKRKKFTKHKKNKFDKINHNKNYFYLAIGIFIGIFFTNLFYYKYIYGF